MSEARSLFELLRTFEQRSIRHDATGAGAHQQRSNFDGVVFRIGEHRLTVPITAVEEILPVPQTTPVPGAKEWLLGLANVRGNLVTIVDLGWYLLGSRTPQAARTRLILTRLQSRHLGLIVDEVFGQRHLHTDELVAVKAEAESLGGMVARRFARGEEKWGLFRLEELMARPDFLDGARGTRGSLDWPTGDTATDRLRAHDKDNQLKAPE